MPEGKELNTKRPKPIRGKKASPLNLSVHSAPYSALTKYSLHFLTPLSIFITFSLILPTILPHLAQFSLSSGVYRLLKLESYWRFRTWWIREGSAVPGGSPFP